MEHNFFTRINGVRAATPMLLVVLVLGSTDIVFAVDSIPTVFGITTNSFVVWSSNAMAVLGMRPLFFLIAGLVRLFTYLQFGLAAILGFVGAKMITEEALHAFQVTIPITKQQTTFISLGVIVGILVLSVLASVMFRKDEDPHHLPEAPAEVETSGEVTAAAAPARTPAMRELEHDLKRAIAGEVRFDPYSREMYATDGSIYRMAPLGVVLPRDADDVSAAIETAARHGAPVLPRGGGTGLAGQTVNRAVVLDFSKYMHNVLEVNTEERWVRTQPGIAIGELNRQIASDRPALHARPQHSQPGQHRRRHWQ